MTAVATLREAAPRLQAGEPVQRTASPVPHFPASYLLKTL